MTILAIADIDDLHWPYGNIHADILLSCGDVFDEVILEAASVCGCHAVFAVKGNHDRPCPFPEPIIDLHLQIRRYGGLLFGGFNGSWRYKPRGSFLYLQDEATALLQHFAAVDIFLAHNSPAKIYDKQDGIHCGFFALHDYIVEKSPSILIHGHQHVDEDSFFAETHVSGVYGYKLITIGNETGKV